MQATFKVEFYPTARGDEPTREFIDSLEMKARAKVYRWLGLLEEMGPDLPRPFADVLSGPIRELRISSGRLEVRLLYFFHGRTVIVIAHGFLKKTRTVSAGDLERAERAQADWLKRFGGTR